MKSFSVLVGIVVSLFVLFIPLPVSASEDSPEIPVLMYHILLQDRNDTISVDPVRFREQIEALHTAGYTGITVSQLDAHLQHNAELPPKPILITFDDGYKSNYTEAYPVLKEFSMPATIYAIVSRMYESPTLIKDEYEKITWADAREMNDLVEIHSHTYDSHKTVLYNGRSRGLISVPLSTETEEKFRQRITADLILSKQLIEEHLLQPVTSIAYPYGHFSQTTLEVAQELGFTTGFTVQKGLVSRATAIPLRLNRITADGRWTGTDLVETLEASYSKLETPVFQFTDLNSTHFAYDSIMALYTSQIVNGFPSGEFLPQRKATRAEAARMLVTALRIPAPTRSTSYTDLKDTHWAYSDISAATEAGLFQGRPDGSFGPNDYLQRSEMASLLMKAFQLSSVSNHTFTDVVSTHWASESISALYVNGLTQGYPDGTFRPKNATTRAEFSVFLDRSLKQFPSER